MKQAARSLASRQDPLSAGSVQLQALRSSPALQALPAFQAKLAPAGLSPLRPTRLEVLQLNLGKLCNQTCRHCHVDAGPDRREVMDAATLDACVRALESGAFSKLDLTGGAPEMNPGFRGLIRRASALGVEVMVRCNLTILRQPGYADLVDEYARLKVHVISSLPSPDAGQTDRQRGEGVYADSIAALKALNAVGYGREGSGLQLDLVSNPVGAFLPGEQKALEAQFKARLLREHGIVFNSLFVITNMPISRYLDWLLSSGNLQAYMERLVTAFNPAAAAQVMCRNTLSVGWDGTLYDCDFNQMLELPLRLEGRPRPGIRDLDPQALLQRAIVLDQHCYGCTAGAGSSCGGALA